MKDQGLVDTHCHLDLFKPEEVSAVIERARVAGVGRLVSVGTDIDSSQAAVAIAREHNSVFAAVGIHPHEAKDVAKAAMTRLRNLASGTKVVALGETGLDYYYLHSPKEAQIESFKRHIELAAELDLPLIIHCREAYDDLIDILRNNRPDRTIIHCFSGGPAEMAVLLEFDCYISFSGTVTFPNAVPVQEAAVRVPAARLLVETDAPFLAPQTYRGQRNESAYLPATAAKIADLKGKSYEQVIKETSAVADTLLGLGTGSS